MTEEELKERIEALHNTGISNYEISEILDISIYKVRGIVYALEIGNP